MPHQCHTNEIHLSARKLSAELRGAMNREIVGSPEGEASSKSDFRFAVTTARTSVIALVNQTVAAAALRVSSVRRIVLKERLIV